jgi:NADPH2:quinone reductase
LAIYDAPMRAVRCHELTGPAALRVDDLDDPVPAAGEVVVDVRAAGVNFPDLLITQGLYQFKPPTPFIPGGEIAGVVAAIGAGVTRVAVGDRVAATMLFGAFTERAAVPEAAVTRLPDGISFEIGAATFLTYATTMHALVDRAAIKAGETLLVLGAAGGVGTSAIQIGKALGARVIAAASSAEKLAYCEANGADELIDTSRENLKDRAKALSGNGVDVVYDPVGGEQTEAALRAMAWAGRLLVIGFASGVIPKIPANLTLLKSCSVVGVFWGAFAMRTPAENQAHVDRVLGWIAEGRVKPQVDAVLPFSQAREALERIQRREVKGKLVLVPGPK